MERRYAPYSKWFGTAFQKLHCAGELTPIFRQILEAQNWNPRQEFLARAYEVIARLHNALGVTIPLKEAAEQYYGRPYLVIGDDRYVEELRKAITSEEVRKLPQRLGSVNQFVDSNDQLNDLGLQQKLKMLYA
jgi:hypothetical protein